MGHPIPGKFSNIRSKGKLWNSSENLVDPEDLPSLPIECLQPSDCLPAPDRKKQEDIFEETVALLKESLLGAKKTAILARSQSMEAGKRQTLCHQALKNYQRAIQLRNKLRSLTARMSLDDRRRVRALEGAPEWRQIRHAIQRSADLNRVALSFAA